ncbi:C-type lectin domain family 4 member E-like isoform X2 [Echeneis naucrates]|uniref:C-type lectin domain family 4 member E-like isoform X2 n=1 Tax=Echeneis naucrates TaxID=173247 RepID=UPI0011132FA0|nr:C-type lectin domain family 4 member E-like isoform X2 [Echeneis naucrates]
MNLPRHKPEDEAAASQQPNSAKGSKVTAERVALLVLSAVVVAAAIVIYRVSSDHFQTNKELQELRDKFEEDRLCGTEPNNTLTLMCPKDPEVKRNETYPRCEEGWEHNGGKCYLFSTNGSSWEKSRDECKQLGGDLVKIDSREEQGFLIERLRITHRGFFWIGLTDSKNESDWLWVDGSPLDKSWTFWRSGEPDNWKEKDPDGEDCVAMGETGKILESWNDDSCKTEYKRICEKEEEVGLYTITCV